MWRDTDEAFITIGFGGLPEAQPIKGGAEFLVVSEKDGWMHVYRVTRDGTGHARHARRHGRDRRSPAWTRAAGRPVLHRVAGRTRRSATCIARRSTARLIPCASRRERLRRHQHATTSRPNGRFAFHRFSSFDDPGLREVVSLPDHARFASTGDSAGAEAGARAAARPAGRVLQGRRRRRRQRRRLRDQAAGLRSVEAVSGAGVHLRRAGEPDGDRQLGRQHRRCSIATSPASATSSSASTTPARRRRAGARGARRSTARSACCRRSSRRRRCARSTQTHAVRRPRSRRASGDGAAAARTRST